MQSWKGVTDMYINPILVGVIGTLIVEAFVLIGVAIYLNYRR